MPDGALEAVTLFQQRAYAQCLGALEALNQENHVNFQNTSLVRYVAHGGNHAALLHKLNTAGHTHVSNQKMAVPSLPAPGWLFLEYAGIEYALFNRAAILLHCGEFSECVKILRHLLTAGKLLRPALAARIAIILNVACEQMSLGADPQAAAVLKDTSDLIAKDPVLTQMRVLTTGNLGDLKGWFQSLSTPTASQSIVYYNNVGVEYMNDGKFNLAGLAFQKSVQLVTKAKGLSAPLADSVAYNTGLCALARKEGSHAHRCFMLALNTMSASPTLWLRIAQCCVEQRDTATRAAQVSAQNKEQIAAMKEEPSIRNSKCVSPITFPSSTTTFPKPSVDVRHSLESAAQALANALLLLKAPASGASLDASHSNFVLLQHVLVYFSYVELCRSNFAAALRYCHDLFALGKPSDLNKDILLVATSHAVEAMCSMGKPQQALKYLQGINLSELLTPSDSESGKLNTEALLINLAVVHLQNGSFNRAQDVVSILAKKPSKHSILLQVYVELSLGNKEAALEIWNKSPVVAPFL